MGKLTVGQKLYRSHERRMWVSTVILPILGGCIILGLNPDVQSFVKKTKDNIKSKIKQRKSKESK